MPEHEIFAGFWGHMEELRCTLRRILTLIVLATAICFVCSQPLIALLKASIVAPEKNPMRGEPLKYYRLEHPGGVPQTIALPKKSLVFKELSHGIIDQGDSVYQLLPGGSLVYAQTLAKEQDLVLLGPLEGILISLKISFWAGIFLSSPLWLFLLGKFFLPGLRQQEKRLIIPFILTSIAFIALGCLFSYFVTIPLSTQYLATFNETLGTNLWSLGNSLNYTLFVLMANGIAFEIAAVGVFAVHLGLISVGKLKANRHFAILGAFIIAALLTPPDVLTQLLLAFPLVGLYEMIILYARATQVR